VNRSKIFLRDGISKKRITAFLFGVEVNCPGRVPKTLGGVSALAQLPILEEGFLTCDAEVRKEKVSAQSNGTRHKNNRRAASSIHRQKNPAAARGDAVFGNAGRGI